MSITCLNRLIRAQFTIAVNGGFADQGQSSRHGSRFECTPVSETTCLASGNYCAAISFAVVRIFNCSVRFRNAGTRAAFGKAGAREEFDNAGASVINNAAQLEHAINAAKLELVLNSARLEHAYNAGARVVIVLPPSSALSSLS